MEETKKRTHRTEAERRAALEATIAKLDRKGHEARLKATKHGKHLYQARGSLVALCELFDDDGALPDVVQALACVDATIERCLAVVRSAKA